MRRQLSTVILTFSVSVMASSIVALNISNIIANRRAREVYQEIYDTNQRLVEEFNLQTESQDCD